MLPEDKLIARLMTVYGEPRTDDPDAFLAEYRKALAGYSAEVLAKAGDEIIKGAVYWPRPAEAIATARRVAAELERMRPKPVPKADPEGDATPADLEASRRRIRALLAETRAVLAMSEPPQRSPRILSPTSQRMTGDRE